MKKTTVNIPSPIQYIVGNIPILVTYENSMIAKNLEFFAEPFNSAGIKFVTAILMDNKKINLTAYNMTEKQAKEYGRYIRDKVDMGLI